MRMIAKFSSTCRQCGKRIKRGEAIEWQRGLGAAHARCATSQAEGFRPGYSDADIRFDEQQFERNAGYSFMAGLR